MGAVVPRTMWATVTFGGSQVAVVPVETGLLDTCCEPACRCPRRSTFCLTDDQVRYMCGWCGRLITRGDQPTSITHLTISNPPDHDVRLGAEGVLVVQANDGRTLTAEHAVCVPSIAALTFRLDGDPAYSITGGGA